MSDQPLKDLDPRVRKQVEKAVSLIHSGNPSQAIAFCTGLLKSFPGSVEIRKVLREAQRAMNAGKKKSFLSGLHLFKAQNLLGRKDPKDVLVSAEEALNKDPVNVDALKAIAAAAKQLELPHTAVFALENIRDINNKDVENLKALANAYIDAGNVQAAINTADKVIALAPGDGEAQEISKRASVMQSLDKGKWEDEGSDFRSKLKDAEEATRLEQLNRARTDEAGLSELIADLREKIAEEPENVNHFKKIAGYHEQAGDFAAALAAIQEARQTESGKGDTALEKLETRFRTALLKKDIEEKEAALETNPDDAVAQSALDEARAELERYELEAALETVEKYPNDYAARYHLGALLLKVSQVDEAIQHLQIATRNPKVRLQAILALGKAYTAKGFHDLAAEQFRTAKADIPIMNQQKKEAIYELGCAFEAQGKTEQAMTEFKEVYAADIGFRDVAQKIDSFYANR